MLRALPSKQWNYTTAAHLLNRAGFGATPSEIDRAVEAGLPKTLDRLLNFASDPEPSANPGWAKPDPERFKRMREMREALAGDTFSSWSEEWLRRYRNRKLPEGVSNHEGLSGEEASRRRKG